MPKINKSYTIKEIDKSISRLTNFHSINKKFVITKKIAKHGNQAIIVIPRVLEQHLKPGTLMQLTIDVLDVIEEKEEIVDD
jgi:hypothetical protein